MRKAAFLLSAILLVSVSCKTREIVDVVDERLMVEIMPPEGYFGIIGIGDSVQFRGVVRDENWNEVSGKTILWSSTDPYVASVDQTGLAIGLAMGYAGIEATVEGSAPQNPGWYNITVTGPPSSIEISPDTLAMVTGARRQLRVLVADVMGTLLTGAEVVLSTEDSAVAVPVARDIGGHPDPWMPIYAGIEAVGVGTVAITAKTGEMSDTATVTVAQVHFDSLTLGGSTTCGFERDGGTYCWGDWRGRSYYGYGDVQGDTPAPVLGNVSFISLSVGSGHTCGLNSAGDGYCWGNNYSGQLGSDYSYYPPDASRPVSGVVPFTRIAVGGAHTCAISAGGALYCWGANYAGQLGATARSTCGGGKTSQAYPCSYSPVRVDEELEFESLTLGQDHTCAVDVNGAAYCWGDNAFGQLGDGTRSNRTRPKLLPWDMRFRYLTAGDSFTCGLTVDGNAYCWGANEFGQVGQTGTADALVPRQVYIGGGLLALSSGSEHACALAATGVAMCWGSSEGGRLGVAASGGSMLPVTVETDLTFRSIRAGGNHTCAMSVTGLAYCWGHNGDGQLGVLDLELSPTPVLVTGQPEVP